MRLQKLRVEALQERIGWFRSRAEYTQRQLGIVDAELTKLPENREKVLRVRYVEGMSWNIVGNLAGYSISHCRNMNLYYSKQNTQRYKPRKRQ